MPMRDFALTVVSRRRSSTREENSLMREEISAACLDMMGCGTLTLIVSSMLFLLFPFAGLRGFNAVLA